MALPVEEEKVFNHFSKFPLEIRDAIWKNALPFRGMPFHRPQLDSVSRLLIIISEKMKHGLIHSHL